MLSTLTGFTTLMGLAAAAPFNLPNGFPTIPDSNLPQVYMEAGGTLPNTPLPTTLPADAIQTLQVIAYNEIFEVAFFSSFLGNVTNGTEGFTDLPYSKEYLVDILTAVRAQEELHATGANAILATANATTIGACNYMFPSMDFTTANSIASLFTSVVLGVLQEVTLGFAMDGTNGTIALTQLIASIIGQEAEQNGGYRMIQNKIPSSAPFLTPVSGKFAFNAIAQNFIVPGSCDDVFSIIDIPVIDSITVMGNTSAIQPVNQTLMFETTCTHTTEGADFMAFVSGQNYPVVVPISNVTVNGGMATFTAEFPFEAGFAKGLTIGALVNTNEGLMTVADVTNAAFAGPALIVVD